jgi:hypothetical protein
MGQEEIKSRKEIALFCDLNSIYSGIDLKYGISKKIFHLIGKLANL